MTGATEQIEHREDARERDRVDPLAAFRARFEIPEAVTGDPVLYLCGNSLGLMPRAVREAVERELHDWGALGVRGHLEASTPWYSYHEACRETGASLVGAQPGEVVVMNSLTANLHFMLVSFYRPQGRRRKILIEDHTFPSDRYAVASHAAWHGHDPADAIVVARAREGEECLRTEDVIAQIDEIGDELAMVMFGGVNYFTGQAFDLASIAEAAHAAGAVAGFDLAHGAGNVEHRLHDWDVDFAVWCSYKYLNSGPGAVGGCFVHERHGQDPSRIRFAGWWGNDPDTRFEMHAQERFEPRPGADGWQVSNPPILALAPVRASLDLFQEAGMPALRQKSIALTGFCEALLRTLGDAMPDIISPTHPNARGCQLSLRVGPGARGVFDALTARGVVTDFRDPDIIRVAPVPLYNSFTDVWDFVDRLRGCLRGGAVT